LAGGIPLLPAQTSFPLNQGTLDKKESSDTTQGIDR
jgi:hypothetical protein